MNIRTREEDSEDVLLDDLQYIWESQGPSGQARGRGALEELLYRWDFLPPDWWEKQKTLRTELLYAIPTEVAVASIAIEAEERGYDHGLYLDKV